MKIREYSYAAALCCLLILIGCAGSGGDGATTNGSTDGTTNGGTTGERTLTITTLRPSDRMAVQTATGNWAELQRSNDGKFRTEVTDLNGCYSVALLRAGEKVDIFSLTLADTKSLNLTVDAATDRSSTLTIAGTNQPPNSRIYVGTGRQFAIANEIPRDFQYRAPADLVTTRTLLDDVTGAYMPTGIVIERGISGNVTRTYDFNSSAFLPLQQDTWTVPPVTGLSYVSVDLETDGMGIGDMGAVQTGRTITFSKPADDAMQPGDHFLVYFHASSNRDVSLAAENLDNVTALNIGPPISCTSERVSGGRRYDFVADVMYGFFDLWLEDRYHAFISSDWLAKQATRSYLAGAIDLPGYLDLTRTQTGGRLFALVAGGSVAENIERYSSHRSLSVLDMRGAGDGRFAQQSWSSNGT